MTFTLMMTLMIMEILNIEEPETTAMEGELETFKSSQEEREMILMMMMFFLMTFSMFLAEAEGTEVQVLLLQPEEEAKIKEVLLHA